MCKNIRYWFQIIYKTPVGKKKSNQTSDFRKIRHFVYSSFVNQIEQRVFFSRKPIWSDFVFFFQLIWSNRSFIFCIEAISNNKKKIKRAFRLKFIMTQSIEATLSTFSMLRILLWKMLRTNRREFKCVQVLCAAHRCYNEDKL